MAPREAGDLSVPLQVWGRVHDLRVASQRRIATAAGKVTIYICIPLRTRKSALRQGNN